MLATALTVIAIVTQDQSALRASPRDSAPQQAMLWQGDSLEIRGEKGDYLQVYDHRHERAGYVRATQVRVQPLKEENAPELIAVVRFLRDTPGAESLGISYATAFLAAAPAKAIDAEVFDALGSMAERLAQRASSTQGPQSSAKTNAHLDVVSFNGVKMQSFEKNEQVRMCYDGEAFRRVMALPASPVQKANAALSLTRHDCISPDMTPTERFATDNWRAEVLERVDTKNLPEVTKNRIAMRKAGVWASLAFQTARRPEFSSNQIQATGNEAINQLALVNKSELAESDRSIYTDAATRVGASRWAALPNAPTAPAKPGTLSIVTSQGQPGETCVHLVDDKHTEKNPLFTRCTYGIVWQASATVNRNGSALALAVQPLDTWREMWVFQNTSGKWAVDVVPPGVEESGQPGYVEFAGWVPGNKEVLAAREVKTQGRYKTSFELLSLTTLETTKQAEKPNHLSVFYRWQDPIWKTQTVSLR